MWCLQYFIPNSDEFKQNVAQEKFYAHTDLKKLEGTLATIQCNEWTT